MPSSASPDRPRLTRRRLEFLPSPCRSRGALLALLLFLAARSHAASFVEDFSSDPVARGWRAVGHAELFRWNAVAQALDVTWDSSKPNSYFCRTLGTVLAKTDNVQLSFDLQIDDVAVGISPDKPFTFELAVGLINLRDATAPNFIRGTATQSPNLLELDYFPDSGYGATLSPAVVSSNNQFAAEFTFPLELAAHDLYHVQLSYSATDQVLTTTLQRNGEPAGPVKEVKLNASFTDFRLDTVAISSYSDEGADGSLLAHGRIDNISLVLPDPPQPRLTWKSVPTGQAPQVQFQSHTNWHYTLERTVDWAQWLPVSSSVPGNGELLALPDASPSPDPSHAFYRVRLDRP